MPRKEPLWIKAERYEASISANRRRADVKDALVDITFIMLDRDELLELGVILERAMETMDWGAEVPEPGTRFIVRTMPPHGEKIYLTDQRNGRTMIFTEQIQLEELRELLEHVMDAMGGPIMMGAVFETPWIKRLKRDHAEMEDLKNRSSILDYETSGDPPDRYLVTFKGRGLVKKDGDVDFTDYHQVEIILSLEYPRRPPKLRWLTPIHHPNIWGAGTVCLREFWSVMTSRLVDVVAILWDMARLQILNPRSAYTGGVDATKEWTELERRFGPFPVDARPIDDLAPKAREAPGEPPEIFLM